MTSAVFGTLPDGRQVHRVTLTAHGMTASVITWGASLQDLRLSGIAHPLVLGFPDLAPYLAEGRYFGAIVGRCANRIAGGRAQLGDRTLDLDRNERGRTTLHGGSDGTGQRNWIIADQGADFVALSDHLPDGHMGFPGALLVRVTYRLLPGPALHIGILASTTDDTLCNFAQHSYFNLDGRPTIADHRLTVPADTYLPVDGDLIPLGPPAPVQGTALDFRQPARLGDRLGGPPGGPPDGPGIDHNLCLAPRRAMAPRRAATLRGRSVQMTIDSTEPGLQVYDGALLRPGAPGLDGQSYGPHAGIALESQLWPDAPHHPSYPSAVLEMGQLYRQATVLGFARVRGG